MTGLIIENLISVDDTGIPKAPKINQIIDKDVFLLYSRDTSKDKKKIATIIPRNVNDKTELDLDR